MLADYEVPLHKLIGVCADGASTMQGIYRGVCTRLLNHVRELCEQVRVLIADGAYNRTNLGYFPSTEGYIQGTLRVPLPRVNCN